MRQAWGQCRRDFACPGRGAAFFTLLRRTGTHILQDAIGPRISSAPQERCAASGERCWAGKFCRDGIYCREICGMAGAEIRLLLAFCDGMEFADPSA
jgi:hypothetical protein